jgi:hypothetical protein
MYLFDDPMGDDFLFDDRFEDDFNDGELYADGDAYALEDLLRLVQQDHYNLQNISADKALSTTAFSSDEDALIWGLSILCQSPLGRAMAFDARFDDWALEVDDIEDNQPIIDAQLRILILPRGTPSVALLSKSHHDRLQFLTALARGLRLVWQAMNAIQARHDLTADDQIFLERLRAADVDVITLRMMWDLREDGYTALWRHAIAGPIGDVALSASHFWEDEPFPSGMAQSFLAWMSCEQLLADRDNRTLDAMDARLQKSVSDVCGLAMLTGDDILALSRYPEGGSYLASLARTLCYTTELRHIPDPVNEAHLRQILEECSEIMTPSLIFRDSELERKIFPDRMLDTMA